MASPRERSRLGLAAPPMRLGGAGGHGTDTCGEFEARIMAEPSTERPGDTRRGDFPRFAAVNAFRVPPGRFVSFGVLSRRRFRSFRSAISSGRVSLSGL
jgi:hypothetical protein